MAGKKLMGPGGELLMRFDVEIAETDFAVSSVSDFDDIWKQLRSQLEVEGDGAEVVVV